MGDRCHVVVQCRTKDVPLVEKCLGESSTCFERDEPPGWSQLEWEEYSSGASSERESLASNGVLFHGFHFAGCSYGPCLFASTTTGTLVEADCDHDLHLVVRLDEDGRIDLATLTMAYEYIKALAAVRAAE